MAFSGAIPRTRSPGLRSATSTLLANSFLLAQLAPSAVNAAVAAIKKVKLHISIVCGARSSGLEMLNVDGEAGET